MEGICASMREAAKAMGQSPEQVEAYTKYDQRAKELWAEIQAAMPLATQAHGIANRIQRMDQSIAKLKDAVSETEAEILKQQTLLAEQQQQLREKTAAREAMQLEYVEMLKSTVPPATAGSPAQSREAVVTAFQASLEQMQNVITQLGAGEQLTASCLQQVTPWLAQVREAVAAAHAAPPAPGGGWGPCWR